MSLFGWFRKGERATPRAAWRAAWAAAVVDNAEGDVTLRRALEQLSASEPDVEVELEMLDAIDQLRQVQASVAAGQLPTVETHHRVIGAEGCHFSAPASLPTDQGQAAGRLLLTPTRAVFVGGGRTAATAWHAVHEVLRLERDVLLVRPDKTSGAHFRFNTYGDAVLCAFLAQQLRATRRARL